MNVDVLVLCALSIERDAVLAVFKECEDLKCYQFAGQSGRTYTVLQMPLPNEENGNVSLSVAVGDVLGMGPLCAATRAAQILDDIVPTLVVLVGISGCMASEEDGISLGDVGVATHIIDCTLVKREKGREKPNYLQYPASQQLLRLLEQSNVELPVDEVRKHALGSRTVVVPEEKKQSVIRFGPYLSGSFILADDDLKEELYRRVTIRKLIGIEMEAAGVLSVLHETRERPEFLLVKAFCDWGDAAKAGSNTARKVWQPYAATASAHYLKVALENVIGSRVRHLRYPIDGILRLAESVRASVRCYLSDFPNLPQFVGPTVERVFESAIQETRALVKSTAVDESTTTWGVPAYDAMIGQGRQFLLRAEPIFRSARELFVVSLDKVSRFWMTAPHTAIKSYIQAQSDRAGCSTRRLFVFDRPEDAHRHARRLDYHSEAIKGTYVCSFEHYERLVRERICADPGAVDSLLARDFAILTYDNGVTCVANLSDDQLHLQLVNQDGITNGINVEAVKQLFAEMHGDDQSREYSEGRGLKPGEIREVDEVPILRWERRLWYGEGKEKWRRALERMFEARSADVLHVVGFRDIPARIQEEMVRFRHDIATQHLHARRSLLLRHGCRAARMMVRDPGIELRPEGGHEVEQREFLIMLFPDMSDFDGYLRDRERSLLYARALAEDLMADDDGQSQLKEFGVETIENIDSVEDLEGLLKRLEERCGVVRFEVHDNEMLEFVVNCDPPPFHVPEYRPQE